MYCHVAHPPPRELCKLEDKPSPGGSRCTHENVSWRSACFFSKNKKCASVDWLVSSSRYPTGTSGAKSLSRGIDCVIPPSVSRLRAGFDEGDDDDDDDVGDNASV